MFTRHLIGPAAQLHHQYLLAEVNRERQLVLAAARETAPCPPSGASAPTMALNRIVHAARFVLTLRATGVFGTGFPSRPRGC